MINLTGNIKDVQTGALIPDAIIQETYFKADDKTLTPYGIQTPCPGGVYSVTVPAIDDTHYFLITAPGYNIFYANDPVFQTTPDVMLLKATGSGEKLLIPAGILLILALHKKHAVGKMESKDVYPYLLIAGAVIVLGLLKGVAEKLGIVDTPETKALNVEQQNPGSFWKPAFYRQYGGNLSNSEIGQFIVNMIMNFTSESPDAVISQFQSLSSQSDVSQIDEAFITQSGGQDLLTYLRGTLFAGHLGDQKTFALHSYISKNLPTN